MVRFYIGIEGSEAMSSIKTLVFLSGMKNIDPAYRF